MVVAKRRPKPLLVIIVVVAVLLIIVGGSFIYLSLPVDAGDKDSVEVSISSGTGVSSIASILKEKNLIKSELLFKIYVKVYNVKSLKAATYIFDKSMDLKSIIETLEKGSSYNPNLVKITFKEGGRVTDFAKEISLNTNNSYDDIIAVFKDVNYMNTLISKYWFLTDNILNPSIYYPLEGYLTPDTYHFDNRDVSVQSIIVTFLDESLKRLNKYKDALNANIHNYMTMASIVELEGTNLENRKMIVGVFNNRLQRGMNLGSDVTTYYGLQAAMTRDLTVQEFNSVNDYNTRVVSMNGKMPVGPICNPSISSVEASISPISSDYLFFVADKHGKIFYTKTNREHEEKVKEIKAKGDWIW